MTAREWVANKWAGVRAAGGATADIGRSVGRVGKAGYSIGRGGYRVGREAVTATKGMFGMAGALLRGATGAVPMALVVAGGLGYGVLSTLGQPYNMSGPDVAYGYTPGATNAPLPQPTMEFGMKRNNIDPFASGTLSLALFNQRKA